jgi:hypothetical protein
MNPQALVTPPTCNTDSFVKRIEISETAQSEGATVTKSCPTRGVIELRRGGRGDLPLTEISTFTPFFGILEKRYPTRFHSLGVRERDDERSSAAAT